jgi:hypothetical protein
MTKNILALFFSITSLTSFSQDTCNDFPVIDCTQFNDNFEPENLTESISFLECIWGKDDLEKFRTFATQNEKVQIYLEKKIFCTNQKLPLSSYNSKLSRFFLDKHRDLDISTMESIVFESLHRKLNGKEIKLDEQIKRFEKSYNELTKKGNAEYINRRNKEFGKFRVGDIVEFSYKYYFLERPKDCKVEAFINEIDSTEFMLKLEIIENCENEEFQVVHSKIYLKENDEFQLQSEEVLNLTPNGETIWTPYFYWTKTK